ncbi:MAG: hypothetical protein AB8G86_12795 [Saprospiraceae bacterium]
MTNKEDTTIIGYSGFIFFEDAYLYNENACYVADSSELAEQLMLDCGYSKLDFRIDEISLNDLLNDFGCSCHEYAMEKLAFKNFKLISKENDISFESEKFDTDLDLMVVNIRVKKNNLDRNREN